MEKRKKREKKKKRKEKEYAEGEEKEKIESRKNAAWFFGRNGELRNGYKFRAVFHVSRRRKRRGLPNQMKDRKEQSNC